MIDWPPCLPSHPPLAKLEGHTNGQKESALRRWSDTEVRLPPSFTGSETTGKLHTSLPLKGHDAVCSLSVQLGNLDDTREVFGTQSMFDTHLLLLLTPSVFKVVTLCQKAP